MALIDPTRNWRLVAERLESETDPRRRAVLTVVLEHMQAEAEADLDRLMATVSPDAAYHFWHGGGDFGPKGHDGVRQYYAGIVAGGANHIQYDVDRLIVDDHGLVTEGLLTMLVPGATAIAMGLAVGDPGADYLYSYRQLLVWPIDENGLVAGEDSYGGGTVELRAVERDELPAAYLAQVHPDAVGA